MVRVVFSLLCAGMMLVSFAAKASTVNAQITDSVEEDSSKPNKDKPVDQR